MDRTLTFQYQQKAEPPSPQAIFNATFESAWHQPWSEPVRQLIKPALAIALAASGFIGTQVPPDILTSGFESKWHYAWSEPVRFKIDPRAQIALAASGPFAPVLTDDQITGKIEARWHYAWSEPVRLPKRLQPGSNQVTSYSSTEDIKYDKWGYGWSTPVWYKIDPRLQIALAAASGPIAPVLTDDQITGKYESRWHYAWSEPVRPRVIGFVDWEQRDLTEGTLIINAFTQGYIIA